MEKIFRGITTAAQAKRDSEFTAALERLRTDGYFDTHARISVGDVVQIEESGTARQAEVARTTPQQNGATRIHFRWLKTPNA